MARDTSINREVLMGAFLMLAIIWIFRLASDSDGIYDRTQTITDDLIAPWRVVNSPKDDLDSKPPLPESTKLVPIVDRVAVISDSKFTNHLIPLIMHFHAVLGPEWPIFLFTTPEVLMHMQPPLASPSRDTSSSGSSTWRHAVASGIVSIRYIPSQYDMTNRTQVNKYLTHIWLWEQLAPAKHVLVFQADSMICSNSRRNVESFFQWDLIGTWISPDRYNGGLSLRNRNMLVEVLKEATWEDDIAAGRWPDTGEEDLWFSHRFQQKNASLPDVGEALQFAQQFDWQVEQEKQPLGYHKVHKKVKNPKNMEEIMTWCPEISLSKAGSLESYNREGGVERSRT